MTEVGWSKKYTVDVTFISGYELNDANRSFTYSTYSVYAVIFWGQGQASAIKNASYQLRGMEVEKGCITSTFGDIEGRPRWR